MWCESGWRFQKNCLHGCETYEKIRRRINCCLFIYDFQLFESFAIISIKHWSNFYMFWTLFAEDLHVHRMLYHLSSRNFGTGRTGKSSLPTRAANFLIRVVNVNFWPKLHWIFTLPASPLSQDYVTFCLLAIYYHIYSFCFVRHKRRKLLFERFWY